MTKQSTSREASAVPSAPVTKGNLSCGLLILSSKRGSLQTVAAAAQVPPPDGDCRISPPRPGAALPAVPHSWSDLGAGLAPALQSPGEATLRGKLPGAGME